VAVIKTSKGTILIPKKLQRKLKWLVRYASGAGVCLNHQGRGWYCYVDTKKGRFSSDEWYDSPIEAVESVMSKILEEDWNEI
jgi:hypothetical protein